LSIDEKTSKCPESVFIWRLYGDYLNVVKCSWENLAETTEAELTEDDKVISCHCPHGYNLNKDNGCQPSTQSSTSDRPPAKPATELTLPEQRITSPRDQERRRRSPAHAPSAADYESPNEVYYPPIKQ